MEVPKCEKLTFWNMEMRKSNILKSQNMLKSWIRDQHFWKNYPADISKIEWNSGVIMDFSEVNHVISCVRTDWLLKNYKWLLNLKKNMDVPKCEKQTFWNLEMRKSNILKSQNMLKSWIRDQHFCKNLSAWNPTN